MPKIRRYSLAFPLEGFNSIACTGSAAIAIAAGYVHTYPIQGYRATNRFHFSKTTLNCCWWPDDFGCLNCEQFAFHSANTGGGCSNAYLNAGELIGPSSYVDGTHSSHNVPSACQAYYPSALGSGVIKTLDQACQDTYPETCYNSTGAVVACSDPSMRWKYTTMHWTGGTGLGSGRAGMKGYCEGLLRYGVSYTWPIRACPPEFVSDAITDPRYIGTYTGVGAGQRSLDNLSDRYTGPGSISGISPGGYQIVDFAYAGGGNPETAGAVVFDPSTGANLGCYMAFSGGSCPPLSTDNGSGVCIGDCIDAECPAGSDLINTVPSHFPSKPQAGTGYTYPNPPYCYGEAADFFTTRLFPHSWGRTRPFGTMIEAFSADGVLFGLATHMALGASAYNRHFNLYRFPDILPETGLPPRQSQIEIGTHSEEIATCPAIVVRASGFIDIFYIRMRNLTPDGSHVTDSDYEVMYCCSEDMLESIRGRTIAAYDPTTMLEVKKPVGSGSAYDTYNAAAQLVCTGYRKIVAALSSDGVMALAGWRDDAWYLRTMTQNPSTLVWDVSPEQLIDNTEDYTVAHLQFMNGELTLSYFSTLGLVKVKRWETLDAQTGLGSTVTYTLADAEADPSPWLSYAYYESEKENLLLLAYWQSFTPMPWGHFEEVWLGKDPNAERGYWRVCVGQRDDTQTWILSPPVQVFPANSLESPASIKRHPDGTFELRFAGAGYYCQDLKNDGTGTWTRR